MTISLLYIKRTKKILRNFFEKETATGILLCLAAIAALIAANSPLSAYYSQLIDLPLAIQVGDFKLHKPLLLWVNDGLMAIFFFLVGLELKREFLDGELSDIKRVTLPALGALGGIALPAAIYAAFNWNDTGIDGWAIPAATDIAFALGILALLGTRVPVTLKILLSCIAIFDDIGAILIIALFYTANLSYSALGIAVCCFGILGLLNYINITRRAVYIIIGITMWIALLKSGIHATLSGILLAFFIPMYDHDHPEYSPLKTLERDLQHTVTHIILPVFAFCNAGVALGGIGLEQFTHNVPLGIMIGLFFGKQIGVFALCWLGIKLKIAKMPHGANWLHLYGVSVLCGIGFTMSLFIGTLAFEETGINALFDERLGILAGSLLSGVWGYMVLRYAAKKDNAIA